MDFPGERKENFRIFIKTGSADGKMRYAKHKDMCYDESVFGCSGNVEHGETTYRYRRKGKRRIQNMKFVVQRVSESEVSVDGERIGKIGKGFLVLIGVGQEDTKETADKMVKKMIGLRIFEDENGKTNLSLADVGGELLLISQFTLYADWETVRALRARALPKRRRRSTNILSESVKSPWRLLREGSSAPI